jgi:hypothetical protein
MDNLPYHIQKDIFNYLDNDNKIKLIGTNKFYFMNQPFLHYRKVHILEPEWNIKNIHQVIGRVIR